MNDIWLSAIKKAMEEQKVTKEALAKELQVSMRELRLLLNGEYRFTFEQICTLVDFLNIDVNDVMGYHIPEQSDILLQEDMEVRINEIARSIPKKNRGSFLRAVSYLVDMFDVEAVDKKKKRNKTKK